MVTFLAQDFISFVPLIVVSMVIVFFVFIVYVVSKATQSNDTNGHTESTGFFRGLVDEIKSEFGQSKSANQSADYDKRLNQKLVKNKIQNISNKSEVSEQSESIQISKPLQTEEEKEVGKNILQEMLQDEDILSKFILGEIIMTPKAKRKNIRR